MMLDVRCKCGWCGQVNQPPANEQAFCPDCGEPIPAAARSVPYGYPPLPTWQSQQPKPRRIPTPAPVADTRTSNSEAWSGLVLGVCALWLAGAGCGVSIISIVFGGLALSSGFRARAIAAQQHKPRPFKALLAIVFAVIALAISATSLIEERRARGADSGCIPCVQIERDYEYEQVAVPAVQPRVPDCAPAPEGRQVHDAVNWADARQDWEAYKSLRTAPPSYGYSYKDFQRWQQEYSRMVHRQRMEAKNRHAPVTVPGTPQPD